jgi:Glu-tRNA(Gln) amidotransferase subunit E-like FAD-binding protein
MGRREGRSLSEAVVVGGEVQPQRQEEWETVCGLEVHVQLGTKTKAFCGCVASAVVRSFLSRCRTLQPESARLRKVASDAVVWKTGQSRRRNTQP